MELSNEMVFGIVTAVVIPLVIWGYKMFAMLKTLLVMHEDPDKYEFGTTATNDMLRETNDELTKATAEQTRQLKELVHYTKAMCLIANNGKEVPPREPDIK